MTEKNTQTQGDRTDPERIIAALRELRSPFALYEQDIHQAVTRRLTEAGLPFTHEKNLAPGCRIDFWCGGVGIEIKKGKPVRRAVMEQAARYLESGQLEGLLLVVERSANLPGRILDKPVVVLGLNRLWGVALP